MLRCRFIERGIEGQRRVAVSKPYMAEKYHEFGRAQLPILVVVVAPKYILGA